MVARIPITHVQPLVEGGRYPVKGSVDESLIVSARVFREGHEKLGCGVVLTDPGGADRRLVPMVPTGEPDHYEARVAPDAEGAWTYRVESWSDPYATWKHAAEVKIDAGVDVELMLLEGARVLERAAEGFGAHHPGREHVTGAVTAGRDESRPVEVRLAALTSPEVQEALADVPLRDFVSASPAYPLFADRERARFGSWYEFFPRSEGSTWDDAAQVWRSGSFQTAAERLPAVAEMGFDVVYLPPIHPIGEVNRKGPNNTLTPGPADPGSPWAIGSRHGGHDAIHPDLGTIDDFDAFVTRARELGLEIALDLALQCAPDHPWVTSHPEWFTTRADGSIAYAENPPKKYQDIYPLNFDNDPDGLAHEVLRIVRYWMSHGVRIFRVDNPHTKPVSFWEWLLGEVRRTDPDVLFLSEAFTRPAMLQGLGMIGFHQSYTYFTWRTAKDELGAYLHELSHETPDVVRPNLFVNTPDILHEFLQYGGPNAFRIRATVAAMGAPTWGMYSGFELYEHVAVKPGSEEYLDSEKYQVRHRDWAAADESGHTLAPYVTRLNALRRAHPALQQLRNVVLHETYDDHVLCWSKTSDDGRDTVIVVVNLDPHGTRETDVCLDMPALGMDWADRFAVHDEITGSDWQWGERNYVRLDPYHEVAHVLTVRR